MEGNEINDVAPTSLGHIIGQKSVVEQVAVAVEAAFAGRQEVRLGLADRASGHGQVGQWPVIIADEMAAHLHEVLGQSVASPADLNGLLLTARDRDVIHIDEAHELEKPIRRVSISRSIRGGSFSRAAGADEARRASRWPISRCCCPRPTSTPCSSRFGIA